MELSYGYGLAVAAGGAIASSTASASAGMAAGVGSSSTAASSLLVGSMLPIGGAVAIGGIGGLVWMFSEEAWKQVLLFSEAAATSLRAAASQILDATQNQPASAEMSSRLQAEDAAREYVSDLMRKASAAASSKTAVHGWIVQASKSISEQGFQEKLEITYPSLLTAFPHRPSVGTWLRKLPTTASKTTPSSLAKELQQEGNQTLAISLSELEHEESALEGFERLHFLGRGADGEVHACRDLRSTEVVAIKSLRGDSAEQARRCLREVEMLRMLTHPGIVRLLQVLSPGLPSLTDSPFEVHLVLELMYTDLRRVIHRSITPLTHAQNVELFFQLIDAVFYLHCHAVIHRDIKPSNVLVSQTGDIKVCDFTMARGIDESARQSDLSLTVAVGSPYWRAPEVLLTQGKYGPAADMWSCGVVFAEMLGRKILFQSQDEFRGQLHVMIRTLGFPQESELRFLDPRVANWFRQNFAQHERARLSWTFHITACPASADMLNGLVRFCPHERITAQVAQRHSLFHKHC
ncbi:erkA [Symbiodinium natans]|uniref:ErkA protein n=1 Tax=Symbiodinium natans TaxID=878477 RepID=A0A812R9U0_9DINO|nr:erkA [Symbiodinium natans]